MYIYLTSKHKYNNILDFIQMGRTLDAYNFNLK